MFKTFSLRKVTFTLIVSTYAVVGFAEEKIEGLVTSTKMTMCKFEPDGCAGSLVLDVQREGKVLQVPVKIPMGTQIKNGSETVYLPALRGKLVSIAHKEENGEKSPNQLILLNWPNRNCAVT